MAKATFTPYNQPTSIKFWGLVVYDRVIYYKLILKKKYLCPTNSLRKPTGATYIDNIENKISQ